MPDKQLGIMNNYNFTSLGNMLFIDIEAVREQKTFDEFLKAKNFDNWKKVVAKHYSDVLKSDVEPKDDEIYLDKAGLYAEYSKVVCIGLGTVKVDYSGENPTFEKKMFDITSHDEHTVITKFAEQLNKAYSKNPDTILCGHNILEYDIPFLTKRMIKYKIHIPQILKSAIYGKPWEIKVVDTMRDWRMNTSKYMSMDTICEFIGIPSSKHGEVNGSNLSEFYWSNEGLWKPNDERNDPILRSISKYCKDDVSNVSDICIYFSKL